MRRFFRALAGLPLAALAVGVLYLPGAERVRAQTPPQLPSGFQPATPRGFVPPAGRGAAVPPVRPRQRSPYEVTARAKGGPWMVLAATYTCPDAVYLAEQMVAYLRTQSPHKRGENAYLWNFADVKRHAEEKAYNERMQRNPNVPYRRRVTRIQEQCGVLIGGYPNLEAATAELKRIKKLRPPVVKMRNGTVVNDTIELHAEKDLGPGKSQHKLADRVKISPFAHAFVIRNPALPTRKVDPTTKVDPLWKDLNAREPYSLLKCRRKYTLVIKFYEGPGTLQDNAIRNQGFLAKLGFGKSNRELLDRTAMQAHMLAEMLTKSGALHQPVYVLHMRHGSIVTVGGYDSLEDREFKEMQQKLSKMRLNNLQGGDPGSRAALETFAKPMPMKVPKL